MKKFILLVVAAILAINTNAVEVHKNIDVYGGVDFVSSYVFRSDKLACETVQPYTGLVLHGKDVDWGSFDAGLWFGLGHSERFFDPKQTFYKELDVYGSYITPGNFVKIGMTYFNYMGYSEWGQQIELGIEVTTGDIPLTVSWFTMVYDENDPDKTYSTYTGIKYVADLGNDWTLTPEVGICFGLNGKTIGYIGDQYDIDYDNLRSVYVRNLSLVIDKYWQVTNLIGVHINGFITTNLWDVGICKFEYGKNLNIGLGVGFSL